MATARPLVLLAAVLLPGSASGGAPRARLLQDGCGCAQCVQKGNTVADCESFGLDCGCYDTCPCATCVGTKGNTVADCASFGLDCGCYADDGSACGGFVDRTRALNDECCDEASEDCSSGRPATCNLGCARVLLPYFDECAAQLGEDGAAPFNDVVLKCQATADACTVPLGPSPCQNGGECSAVVGGGHRRTQAAGGAAPFVCACPAEYFGPSCATYCAPEATCSGHGSCAAADGSCVCDAGFDGAGCETDHTSCSGHGAFDGESNSCRCEAGFGGEDCEAAFDASACNAHGAYSERDGSCDCAKDFGGVDCEVDCASFEDYQFARRDVTGQEAQVVINAAGEHLATDGLTWSGSNSDVVSCSADSVCLQRWSLVLRLTTSRGGRACYQVTLQVADGQAESVSVLDDRLLGSTC